MKQHMEREEQLKSEQLIAEMDRTKQRQMEQRQSEQECETCGEFKHCGARETCGKLKSSGECTACGEFRSCGQHSASEGERIDVIGFSGFRVIQRPADFCYGIDAVLLGDFAKVKRGGRACDLGTGTGIIPLVLRHKTQAAEIWGVELQKGSFELAVRTMELNGLSGEIHVIHCDVKEAALHLGTGSFDTVVSNPPYMPAGGGMVSEKSAKMLARHESSAGIDEFAAAASALLKEKGDFYLVHRPSRLADIFTACRKYKLEPKEMRLVAPRQNAVPNIVLIHCVKYGGAELSVLPTLAVYGEDGAYTEEILRIYERT